MARDTGPLEGAPAAPVAVAAPIAALDPFRLDGGAARLTDFNSVGEALRYARQSRGMSVEDIVAATRVKRAHVAALEDLDLSKLPSRPFVVGYIRAYAKAVGLDEVEAVARFKHDAPVLEEDLPAPIGVDNDGDPRRGIFVAASIAVFAAILLWNIAQRAIEAHNRTASTRQVEVARVAMPAPKGAITLGQPLPPPVEATLPTPYVTPGLEASDPAAAAMAAAEAKAQEAANPTQPRPFVARGPILGAAADQPHVLLRAANEVTLIVRRPGGPVQDILILKAGQAYRAPQQAGLVVDVSMPSSVEYYSGGYMRGVLQTPVTPVSQLPAGP